jgi:hypothetical protein
MIPEKLRDFMHQQVGSLIFGVEPEEDLVFLNGKTIAESLFGPAGKYLLILLFRLRDHSFFKLIHCTPRFN